MNLLLIFLIEIYCKMLHKQLSRAISSNIPLWASVNKTDLMKLRKKTGYTFAHCKKALEVNNNNTALVCSYFLNFEYFCLLSLRFSEFFNLVYWETFGIFTKNGPGGVLNLDGSIYAMLLIKFLNICVNHVSCCSSTTSNLLNG